MQQQERAGNATHHESGYTSLSDVELEVGMSRVTLRKYLRQLNIEPRSFGIGGRTLFISNDEKERVRLLKSDPSLLESLRNITAG